MLHVMGTLDRPSSGTVMIAGREVSALGDRQLSAFFLIDGVTALENVANGLLYSGVHPTERRLRAAEALVSVGLAHRLTHLPNQLSGGERQRVAIARAIVHRPAIVLADEPTGNLDSRSSGAILELIDELHQGGSTIIVITHDNEVANSLPRRIAVRDGRIESDSLQPGFLTGAGAETGARQS
ncbi:UNVERIFIED_CONTAM: hypothetical protein GTU68_045448 [Idotea baltica]|nr:hypothetical protein [Idotea baltica]